MGIRGFAAGICWGILSLLTGCIKDDTASCNTEALLYITVREEGGGVTDDLPGGASVYLFDQQTGYTSQFAVSAEDIESGRPVSVAYPTNNPPLAVAWANTGQRETVTLQPGDTPQQALIRLKKDQQGYDLTPDNLFYGNRPLTGETVQKLEIAPHTGRIHLTTKGLPATLPAEDYYYTIESHYSGYDFTGQPLAEAGEMKLPGIFDGNHDLVTPRVYHLVRYPSAARNRAEGEYATVKLWRKTGGTGDLLLASADKDIDGRPVIPQAGKTINVLIDFRGSSGIEVTVVITDWDEIHQWNEW